ncbi:MAG: DUF2760 domain-containing protein [Lentisphaeria bacterium]|nr:DUF2760 domain-containing protein [Lentisphaeria bacterium]
MGTFGTAWKAFWRILKDKEAAAAWTAVTAPKRLEKPVDSPALDTRDDRRKDVLYALILLQREGRLVDFLNEDISGYSDAQVGAAVRQIHKSCKTVLEDSFAVGPILSEAEGTTVEIPAGFDPSSIRLTGHVTGSPPFTGTLTHPGWRAHKMDVPERGDSVDPSLITPAEVEI